MWTREIQRDALVKILTDNMFENLSFENRLIQIIFKLEFVCLPSMNDWSSIFYYSKKKVGVYA